jgi:hypothetical protein
VSVEKPGDWRMGMSDGVRRLWENEFLGVFGMDRLGESSIDAYITDVV